MAEQDGAAETKDEELSLRDQLMAAFDEVEDDGAAEQDAGTQTGTGEGEPSGAAQERARDEQGRFTSGKGEAKPKPDSEPAERTPDAQQQPKTETPPAGDTEKPVEPAGDKPGDKIELGGRLSEAEKTMLQEVAKVHPRAAQWLADRHTAMLADYTRKTQAVAELDREYRPVQEMFRPWMPRVQAAGFTPASLIKAWASVEQELISGDPGRQLTIVKNIIDQYQLDRGMVAHALGLSAAASPAHADPAAARTNTVVGPDGRPVQVPVVDPAMAPFLQELEGLKQWRQQWERNNAAATQAQQQYAQQQRQAEYQRIGNEIEAFRTETDKDGKTLAHPFFDEVEKDMSMLAQMARARGEKPTLQQLYDSAVWANPATRTKAQAAATAAQQAQVQSAARAKAAQARRAGSSVTGSPATGQTPTGGKTPKSTGSLRDDLEAAFNDSTE